MAKKSRQIRKTQQSSSTKKDKLQVQGDDAGLSATSTIRRTSGTPVFFFKDDGQPYGFLCQWYRCRFTDPESGLEFNCAEQWMMWNKARLANDSASAKEIMATTSPRKQKQLGRDVEGLNPDAWDRIKSGVVERGNYLKFTQESNVVSMKMDDAVMHRTSSSHLPVLTIDGGKQELKSFCKCSWYDPLYLNRSKKPNITSPCWTLYKSKMRELRDDVLILRATLTSYLEQVPVQSLV